jgi:hypothetical protein
MIEFFNSIPLELKVIILSCITIGIIQHYNDYKEKIKNKNKDYS